jgi:hypothetical protein
MNPVNNRFRHSRYQLVFLATFYFWHAIFLNNVYGQAELQPWGNMTGIRIEGQLIGFESSLKVAGKDWSEIISTGKELQHPQYSRDDSSRQTVSTSLNNFFFTEKTEDFGAGKTRVDIQFTSGTDTSIAGAFFCIELPGDDYAEGSVKLLGGKEFSLNKLNPDNRDEYLHEPANGITLLSKQQQLKISFGENSLVIIKRAAGNGKKNFQIWLPVQLGDVKKNQPVHKTFILEASGEIDKRPVILTLDASKQGRLFNGFGGNFRIQNLKTDPQVIDYCLKNLRVAWSRVEMPWRFWQPDKNTDPIAEAKAGRLNPNVQRAMEMAQRLYKMNIPIILSAWSPPSWAIAGKPNFRHVPGGEWGNPLNKDSLQEIYKSIAGYIIYLKENYGTEVQLFSFNESDLGINIRQTPQEHAELIKGLGAYFLSRGLKTKMLLGDNSDATTYEFIYPAMKDPVARQYIGAISFHSWRGWEKPLLEKWADAAKQLNVPLIVAEGSIDAAAWNYPAIFEEQIYAMEEINLYIRLLAICQPLTILQWQLTADYSALSGAGIFGKEGPLQPTRRFWNLKQLASTPKNLKYIPVICNRPGVSCAALGNNATGTYAIHIVNNGTARKVTLAGLPGKVKSFRIYITDKNRSMKEGVPVKINAGKANFNLDPGSYTTLISK